MSAKRPLEILSEIGVTGKGLRKNLNQPIAGLTLLTFFTIAVPAPSRAQIPLLPPPPNVPTAPDVQLPNLPGGITGGRDVPLPAPVQPPARPSCDRTTGSSLPPETAYTLGPGDRLRVDVFDVTEYSGEYAVLVDGTLNLPIVGNLSVRGLTLQQATQLISSRYARFVRRPIITLSLLGTRPIILAVAGEVNRPGTYTLTPNQALGGGGGTQGAVQTGQFPTVTQALTLAGGITQAAEVCQVQIRRRATASNAARVYTVNLWNLLQGNLNQDVTLRDGDTIFIPAVTAINPAETRQLADASFSARDIRPINVTVVGEVGRPGPYSVSGGGEATGGATGAVTGSVTGAPAGGGGAGGGPPTLTKAIQVAGGITALADVRSVTVRRITRLDGVREIKVNLWDLLREGDVTQDITLQEGDTITVPTATALDPAEATQLAGASFAPNTIVVNVVGEVVRAGAIPVPPNTPLNQAVLAAGGFNTRAKKRAVELIRLNPNGTVEKREIQVDLAQGINTEGNPTLRNNDVVVVKRSTLASIGDTLGTILNPVGSFVNLLRLFGF